VGDVYVTKEKGNSHHSLRRLIDYLDLPQSVDSIAIKLNLCDFRSRETGATSDPIIIDAMLNVLREKYGDARIYLVENDATVADADILFLYLGIEEVAKRYGAVTVNLAKGVWVKKKIDGYHFNRIMVPQIPEESDLFINHPKLKTHSITKITCGLKNTFGCLKQKRKIIFHKFLDEAIVDINLALRSDAVIADANICMEGLNGPSYGIPKKLGWFIGGKDIVSVDSFCARLMGFNAWLVGHIRKAERKGIGKMRYSLKGEALPSEIGKNKFEFPRLPFYFNKSYMLAKKLRQNI
jgi:uncharacterized protein (DUF362 family)